ncbi:phage protein [Burkholderia plantarii]|uniref:Bacteriophage protein n=1 Tax=Burkholderia plantarii TaxID=41899 RepID=A0A0B6RSE9_BURPL|nr:hypothetical protein [Burkholderia plantarii]AJK46298.1 hypothetical protein BGL_1c17890 [Burkholderia plantarii]ALK30464.1 putative bacteriophage protein [Burkholderia plantarii]WLE59159.1 hypothetical protein GIY62_00120 [Burkholderia plantarii]GLZ19862.1 hypothetical protein Bpla01_33910 [Burkholderia plantarii]
MTTQFGRKVGLVIGPDSGAALDLSDLRIRFAVKRGDTHSPNTLDLTVYNLSEHTVQKAESKEFTRIVLQAGYEGNYGIIFDGSIVNVSRGRESATDTLLNITANDGDMAYNFAIVNKTLAAGSLPEDHVKACTAAMEPCGVSAGYRPALGGNPLPRGKVMFGMARDRLEIVARTTHTLWSIQDGRLQIVPETSYVPGEVPVITARTGMLETMTLETGGIKVRMLLNPSIRIGHLVKLDNASIPPTESGSGVDRNAGTAEQSRANLIDKDGIYCVVNASIKGDTSGNDWYTEIICLPADATSGVETSDGAGGVRAPAPAKLGVISNG